MRPSLPLINGVTAGATAEQHDAPAPSTLSPDGVQLADVVAEATTGSETPHDDDDGDGQAAAAAEPAASDTAASTATAASQPTSAAPEEPPTTAGPPVAADGDTDTTTESIGETIGDADAAPAGTTQDQRTLDLADVLREEVATDHAEATPSSSTERTTEATSTAPDPAADDAGVDGIAGTASRHVLADGGTGGCPR